MDTSDSLLKFDENGICDYCQNFNKNIKFQLEDLSKSRDKLDQIVKKIKSLADNMRKELGDKLYGIEGSGNRQAGKLD